MNGSLEDPVVRARIVRRTADVEATQPASDPAARGAQMARIRDELKRQNAVLVAHYYTDAAIQVLADETGGIVSDSLEMARFGSEHPKSPPRVRCPEANKIPQSLFSPLRRPKPWRDRKKPVNLNLASGETRHLPRKRTKPLFSSVGYSTVFIMPALRFLTQP